MFGNASWRMSLAFASPSRVLTYSSRIDVMPPIPVPWVFATSPGCTHRISSDGVNPDDRKASTVATRFHSATRSIDSTMSGVTPQRVGSNPVGIWPPTVRLSSNLRGTRISVPAKRVTRQSPVSEIGAILVLSGSAAANALACSSELTVKLRSSSRKIDVSSGEVLSTMAPSSP
ncbi:Uncharacterised protein [Mycobacteroides abscessus subsp. abscessus]|nr:Uncharacterised protein [Mycobacteroides abscessus subsp. abscessus]